MGAGADSPTHAGGVVYRRRDGRVEFLLVTSRRRPSEWVLPKGHVEPGEVPESTARREVTEEAGVVAEVLEPLGTMTIPLPEELQSVRVFLMRADSEVPAEEGRRIAWLEPAGAEDRATHPDTRRMVAAARQALERGEDHES